MGYEHRIRVRYVECDMQGVVYNAHYLTYIDDAWDCWCRELDPRFEENLGWEIMLKRAEIVWLEPVGLRDPLLLRCQVSRWGTTSLDVTYSGRIGDAAETVAFEATITYVTVDHGDLRPVPVPAELRAHLEA